MEAPKSAYRPPDRESVSDEEEPVNTAVARVEATNVETQDERRLVREAEPEQEEKQGDSDLAGALRV